jgi:Uma2 family endonuclease
MATAARFTYDDLLRMPDDGSQYEIIDGELLLNASPIPRHQMVLLKLAMMLNSYIEETACGVLLIAPMDVVLAVDNVLQPDLLYISNERHEIINERNVGGAPDLAVEVLSDGTRRKDEQVKRGVYERFGVVEYWIVEPTRESIKVYRRGEADRFDRATEVRDGGTLTSALFPRLALPLGRIFAV